MDREGVILFDTSLNITLADTSDTARTYRDSVNMIEGRYRSAIPIGAVQCYSPK